MKEIWAIVINPGTNEQVVWMYYDTYQSALLEKKRPEVSGKQIDIMKCLPDGSLTPLQSDIV